MIREFEDPRKKLEDILTISTTSEISAVSLTSSVELDVGNETSAGN